MDNSKIVGVAISVTLGIILLATLLVPIVADAQKSSGTEYDHTNAIYSVANPMGEYPNGAIIDMAPNPENTALYTVTVNGVAFNLGNNQNTVILASDHVYSNKAKGGGSINLVVDDSSVLLDSGQFAHLEFINGIVTVTVNGSDFATSTYTQLVTLSDDATFNLTRWDQAQFTSLDDVIICGYISGIVADQIVMFSVVNGQAIPYEGHTLVCDYALKPVTNTTDVYQFDSLSVTYDDNPVTISRIVVKTDVDGHKDSGPAYGVYAIIPLMVIVALLVFVIRAYSRP